VAWIGGSEGVVEPGTASVKLCPRIEVVAGCAISEHKQPMEQLSDLLNFEEHVAGRFGLVPHFFLSAPDAPEIIENLWAFAE
jgi:hypothetical protein